MTESVFMLLLERLVEAGFKGRISPYLMNEPLLDPRLSKWISIIRSNFPQNIIFINTNGDAIGTELLQIALAESGLDAMQINCYDGKDKFRHKLEAIERWAENDKRILVHYTGSLRKMNERNGRLNVRVKDVKAPLEAFWNRGGHVTWVAPSGKYQKIDKCSFPFEQMYINYLGQAIICCSDYTFKVVLGNVIKTTITEIWSGKAYRELRRCHTVGNFQSLSLCRTCNRIASDG
jgi:hypothetical protein